MCDGIYRILHKSWSSLFVTLLHVKCPLCSLVNVLSLVVMSWSSSDQDGVLGAWLTIRKVLNSVRTLGNICRVQLRWCSPRKYVKHLIITTWEHQGLYYTDIFYYAFVKNGVLLILCSHICRGHKLVNRNFYFCSFSLYSHHHIFVIHLVVFFLIPSLYSFSGCFPYSTGRIIVN